MKIRRFFAQDMRQAIRLVREEQGPDAVILSSRKVEGGIEIVAAVDYDQELVVRMASEQSGGSESTSGNGGEATLQAEADDPQLLEAVMDPPKQEGTSSRHSMPEVIWSQDPALIAMQREIESLRGMLQDQLASFAWNDFRRRDPERVQLIRRLGRLGVDETLAREVAAGVRHVKNADQAWREALYGLAKRIPVAGEQAIEGDGVIALVGPSGVGKTTTVAKLAARHVRRHGKDSVALVTTDAYRIGAYRQLQTFGQLLGVPVHLAETGRQLGDILMGLGDRQRIFVDTAGLSQRDVHLMEELSTLAGIPRLRTLLVVAANVQQSVLEETFAAFGRLPLAGAVLTKVDEASSLGPALGAFTGASLPLVFVSEGQRVPEDLQPARIQGLIGRAVALAAQRRTGHPPEHQAAIVRDNVSRRAHVQVQ